MTTIRTGSLDTYLDLLHSVSDGWAESTPCHDHDHLHIPRVVAQARFGRRVATPVENLIRTMHAAQRGGSEIVTH